MRALVIGIDYKFDASLKLSGCINDATSFKKLLTDKKGLKETDICYLSDDTNDKPTKDVILKQLKKLVESMNKSDGNYYFYYAGHGLNIRDTNGDEVDGNDECLYSYDRVPIVDDEFKAIIMKCKNKNANLFAIVDACHSGTFFDLKYTVIKTQAMRALSPWTIVANNKVADTICGIYMISGCTDVQTSGETSYSGEARGLMSSKISECLTINSDILFYGMYEYVLSKMPSYQVPVFTIGRRDNVAPIKW